MRIANTRRLDVVKVHIWSVHAASVSSGSPGRTALGSFTPVMRKLHLTHDNAKPACCQQEYFSKKEKKRKEIYASENLLLVKLQ